MFKENYLSKENREDYLKSVQNILFKKEINEDDFLNSALIVLDMQEYFLNPDSHAFIPASIEIINNINELIKYFIKNGKSVFVASHIDEKRKDNLMIKWWGDSIKENNSYSEISNLLNTDKCEVFRKTQYDAFHKSNLEEKLKNNGIKNLFICGVQAHICCDATARSSFVKSFQPFIIYDACASYNSDLHLSSLKCLSHAFAKLVKTDELINH